MKEDSDTGKGAGAGFGVFAATQMLPIVAVAMAILAAVWIAIPFFSRSEQHTANESQEAVQMTGHAQTAEPGHASDSMTDGDTSHGPVQAEAHGAAGQPSKVSAQAAPAAVMHASANSGKTPSPAQLPKAPAAAHEGQAKKGAHGATDSHASPPSKVYPVVGMAFVDAVIRPMDYELNHRFFGWRPNDIVEWTDNVNNYQLGVLEVTRRTSRILAERLTRTGSSASFNPNLERAMNWFMIKADRYWFPSAESKYQEGLDELREFYYKLERGEAQFYTRTDNLIPLLSAYQDLLGSCDENLVKQHEADGSKVSFFQADDYFYYTKGVADSLYILLSAIEQDFNIMVSREGGLEVLHHAIDMCHQATEIEPWIVLNSDYSSIFANHRSNMAAPISHARFYLDVLIMALST